jgi:precorrin-8X/cobalt-precorrin-8 methylmutase
MRAAGPVFDAYVIVDWSARGRPSPPRPSRDSIWYCALARVNGVLEEKAVRYVRTRTEAREELTRLLAGLAAAGRTALVGFDFPLGYPRGFARALGLTGPPWRAVWDHLAEAVVDSPENANNRFEVAAALNEKLTGAPFPFWGCPGGKQGRYLSATRHRRHRDGDLPEFRATDRRLAGPKPPWKLYTAGSVGGQALVGIPVVRRLRDDPALRSVARVWPFETGLRALRRPRRGGWRVIIADVYPSMIPLAGRRDDVKDRAQVRALARHFAGLDERGELACLFAGADGLSARERRIVEREEGWILGAGADRSLARMEKSSSRPGRPQAATRPSTTSPKSKDVDARREAEHDAGELGDLRPYLKSPAAIYRRSFALAKAATDLGGLPKEMRPLALRLVHACAMPEIVAGLAFDAGAAGAGRRALCAGAPILVDAEMVAAGIARDRLPADNPVLCALNDGKVARLARIRGTTRAAAAVELWRPRLAGAVVAIGNAPTALFRLLELIRDGAGPPAFVAAFPVGFVGASDAKEALIALAGVFPVPYVTLRGRFGGSALAAAAVNALAESARRRP